MIAFLRGTVIPSDSPDSVVLCVAGVGYRVIVGAELADELNIEGSLQRELHVHSHFVKDEPIRLYGFASQRECRRFADLLNIAGIGPRVAMAIMEGLGEAELIAAAELGDVARLTRIKGVGKKTAENLILGLAK